MSLDHRDKECIVVHTSSTVNDCELGELSDSDEQLHLGDIDAEGVIFKEKEEDERKSCLAARTLKVEHVSDVGEDQLVQYFSCFGEVESVMIPSSGGQTTVTFNTIGVVEQLVGQEHFLGDGQVRLRFLGGSSRSPAPSRQQQQMLNCFRYFHDFNIAFHGPKSIFQASPPTLWLKSLPPHSLDANAVQRVLPKICRGDPLKFIFVSRVKGVCLAIQVCSYFLLDKSNI